MELSAVVPSWAVPRIRLRGVAEVLSIERERCSFFHAGEKGWETSGREF
jgi:hypothetical protein